MLLNCLITSLSPEFKNKSFQSFPASLDGKIGIAAIPQTDNAASLAFLNPMESQSPAMMRLASGFSSLIAAATLSKFPALKAQTEVIAIADWHVEADANPSAIIISLAALIASKPSKGKKPLAFCPPNNPCLPLLTQTNSSEISSWFAS